MKNLLVLLLFIFPISVFSNDFRDPVSQEKPLCDGMSEFRCVNKKMDSICMKNAQKGTPGLCRPVESTANDANEVTCRCI